MNPWVSWPSDANYAANDMAISGVIYGGGREGDSDGEEMVAAGSVELLSEIRQSCLQKHVNPSLHWIDAQSAESSRGAGPTPRVKVNGNINEFKVRAGLR